MGQQTLTAQIVLSGRVDASFGPVSAALDRVANRALAVASGINQVSQPLLRTGKEVTQLYAGFDDAMKYIQAVSDLTESQLEAVEKAARNAGKTTRYSATAAAEALGFGAEAGLDFAENIELLPDVLNMAAAGNMELEKAMDQLLTILYSTGTPLSDTGNLIDQLAMAASSSKTDIESMGEAVARLGGIARYAKGGNEELLAMLAMMAQRGQEGSEAGTYLRNVMLALVAPTKGAAKVMQELALSEQDMEEALEGVNLTNAAKQIKDLKLEVYDADESLRPMIDILWDLKTITDAMTEKERNEVLGNIFPKRTLSAATNLMGELETSYDRIAAAIDGATGAAKRMADTRESGIGGAIRRLTNAADELKLAFGEELAERVDTWADSLRDVSLALSEMPEDKKDLLIDIGSAIAIMGPSAMFAGMTLKGLSSIIAFIGKPYGAVIAGAVVLGLVVTNLHNMAEANRYNAIKRNFGDLEVNADALAKAVGGLDGGMSTALANLDKYGQASEDAGSKYSTLLQTLSGEMNSAVIFDQTISKENKKKLLGYGESMVGAVVEGIGQKKIQMTEFAKLLIEDPGDLAITKEAFGTYFDGLTRGAYEIGAELRSKMTEALRDGKISAEEWEGIRTTAQRLNEIEAQIMNIQQSAETYALLEKGTRLGFGAFKETSDAFIEQQDKIREETTALYDEYIGYVIAAEEEADRQGKGQYTDEELGAYIAERRKDLERVLTGKLSGNSQASMKLAEVMFDGTFKGLEDYSEIMERKIVELMKGNPDLDFNMAWQIAGMSDELPQITQEQLTGFNEFMITVYKMADAIGMKGVKWYEDRGLDAPEYERIFERLYEASNILAGGNGLEDYVKGNVNEALSRLKRSSEPTNGAADEPAGTIVKVFTDMLPNDVIFELSASIAMEDVDPVADDLLESAFGSELDKQAWVLARRNASTYSTGFQSGIKGAFGWGGGGGPGGMGDGYNWFNSKTYAEGGRADEASIFGEAGPEWAIPEAHTARTAELLNSARAASGFTWAELMGMNGGLGGGATYQSNTRVVFAPMVYAQDAQGVKEALAEEYEKFKRYFDDYEAEKERGKWQ